MNPALRAQYEKLISQTVSGEDASQTLAGIIDVKMRAIANHIGVPIAVHDYVDAHRGIEPPSQPANAPA